MTRSYVLILCMMVACMAVTCVRDYPATAPYTPPVVTTPPAGGLPAQQQPSPQRRLYISNDKIRMGMDLNAGGAITYLSEADSSTNMVNNTDLGRQIQTSLYAGPYPYSVNGKDPVPAWINLGWNPVQTGDYYNHPAQIVSYQQGTTTMYVKTIPKIWPLYDEPADCVFEHWYEIKDNTIHVRSRSTIQRRDTTQYESRTQEAPCVYLNGPYYRFLLYEGNQPFTSDKISEYTNREMTNRVCTENWIALLNSRGRGVGIYRADQVRFNSAGFNGTSGGEYDNSAGYVNCQPHAVLDHNAVYEFEYTLVVGTLSDIRQFAYSQPRPPVRPNYVFTNDRQGWYFTHTTDTGWPVRNELNIRWQRDDTTAREFRILGPLTFWQASNIRRININAAFKTQGTVARLVWRIPPDNDVLEIPGRYVDFPIIGDGQFRTYTIDMTQANGWNGPINQISLTSPAGQQKYEKGSTVRIKSITSDG